MYLYLRIGVQPQVLATTDGGTVSRYLIVGTPRMADFHTSFQENSRSDKMFSLAIVKWCTVVLVLYVETFTLGLRSEVLGLGENIT